MTIQKANDLLKGKRLVSAKPEAKTVKLVARRPSDVTELRTRIAEARKSVSDLWTVASKLKSSQVVKCCKELIAKVNRLEAELSKLY